MCICIPACVSAQLLNCMSVFQCLAVDQIYVCQAFKGVLKYNYLFINDVTNKYLDICRLLPMLYYYTYVNVISQLISQPDAFKNEPAVDTLASKGSLADIYPPGSGSRSQVALDCTKGKEFALEGSCDKPVLFIVYNSETAGETLT